MEFFCFKKKVKPSNSRNSAYSRYSIFERYGVKEYLKSDGMLVLPDYRGFGIGKRLLECAEIVCKEHSITVTSSTFTSKYSNQIADECGFEEILNRG